MLGLLAVGVTALIGTFRGALVALSAVLLVLLMDTGGLAVAGWLGGGARDWNCVWGLGGTAAAADRCKCGRLGRAAFHLPFKEAPPCVYCSQHLPVLQSHLWPDK